MSGPKLPSVRRLCLRDRQEVPRSLVGLRRGKDVFDASVKTELEMIPNPGLLLIDLRGLPLEYLFVLGLVSKVNQKIRECHGSYVGFCTSYHQLSSFENADKLVSSGYEEAVMRNAVKRLGEKLRPSALKMDVALTTLPECFLCYQQHDDKDAVPKYVGVETGDLQLLTLLDKAAADGLSVHELHARNHGKESQLSGALEQLSAKRLICGRDMSSGPKRYSSLFSIARDSGSLS